MNNLLDFLLKYKIAFLFLLYILISFGFIVQNNKYHKAGFLNASNFFTGTIHSSFKSVNIYFGLKKENQKLAEENARLKNRINKVEYTLIPPYKIDSSVIDSTKNIFSFDTLVLDTNKTIRYIPALAISNSVNKKLNYIYINKGLKDGVKQDMGVVEPNGVVGVIVNATNYYALIMPITNAKSSLSVKVKNQDYFGTLKWQKVEHNFANIIEIPNHVELQKGDTIITSGYSQIFAQGELIGFVEEAKTIAGSSFLEVKIRLSVNFAKINHCYVIENFAEEEIKTLSIE